VVLKQTTVCAICTYEKTICIVDKFWNWTLKFVDARQESERGSLLMPHLLESQSLKIWKTHHLDAHYVKASDHLLGGTVDTALTWSVISHVLLSSGIHVIVFAIACASCWFDSCIILHFFPFSFVICITLLCERWKKKMLLVAVLLHRVIHLSKQIRMIASFHCAKIVQTMH